MPGADQYIESPFSRPRKEWKGAVHEDVGNEVSAVSRRHFIGKAASLLAALIGLKVGKVAGGLIPRPREEENQNVDLGGVTVGSVGKSDSADVESSIDLGKITDDGLLRSLYPYSELDKVRSKILNTRAEMSKTLVESVFKSASDYKDPIESAAGSSGFKFPDEIKLLMFGMLIGESSANQFATSYDDDGNVVAKGPFQITDEMARAHKLKIANDNTDSRFDKNVSVGVVALELDDAFKYWGDWGMAIWEWHAGRANLQKIVGTYLADNYEGESQRNSETFAQKMKQYHLDAYKILTSDVITKKFKDADWDYTGQFLYRVVAASLAYKEATSH